MLTAPVDGGAAAQSTVGGVVTPAQSLLVVAERQPAGNRGHGVEPRHRFVHPGQDAEIKIDTFNFTRYASCTAKC